MQTATIEIPFVQAGKIHKLSLKLRALKTGEFIEFATRHPIAFGWLSGLGSNLIQKTLKDGKEIVDESEVEAVFELVKSTIVEFTIDSEPQDLSKFDMLPSVVQVAIIAQFKLFNFVAQGDIDFFEEILSYSVQSLISSEPRVI